MPHAFNDKQFRLWDGAGRVSASFHRHEGVVSAVDDEGRGGYLGQGGFSAAMRDNGRELARHALGVETAVKTPRRSLADSLFVKGEARTADGSGGL